jgi:hypothetical protein
MDGFLSGALSSFYAPGRPSSYFFHPSFFLKAILLDDALHAAGADGEAGLAELLGDDVGRGVGVEEAVADDLAFGLVGADGVGLGAALLHQEGRGPSLLETVEHLIIPLSGEAVLAGGLEGAEALALALDEHDQARGDLVAGWDDQFAGRSDDAAVGEFESHGAGLGADAGGERAGTWRSG